MRRTRTPDHQNKVGNEMRITNTATRGLFLLFCAIALFGAIALLGCARPAYVWAEQVPAERAKPSEEAKDIGSGDVVALRVAGQPELSVDYVVGADGNIAIENVGTIRLAGRDLAGAAEEVRRRLTVILESPDVSLSVISRNIEIAILGEVAQPGKYELKSGDGVAGALALAGGLTEFAHRNGIYLVREGEKYRIRFRMDDLTRGGDSARAFSLRDGDLLVVE